MCLGNLNILPIDIKVFTVPYKIICHRNLRQFPLRYEEIQIHVYTKFSEVLHLGTDDVEKYKNRYSFKSTK